MKTCMTAVAITLIACGGAAGRTPLGYRCSQSGRPFVRETGRHRPGSPHLHPLQEDGADPRVPLLGIPEQGDGALHRRARGSAAADKFRIQMIPTQIFFNAQGKEVKRHIGFMEKAEIVKETEGGRAQMTFLDNIEQIVAAVSRCWPSARSFWPGSFPRPLPASWPRFRWWSASSGATAEGDRWKAFRYSLAFILGLSLTFTAFGAAAGLLGTMFGTLGGWWYMVAGAWRW